MDLFLKFPIPDWIKLPDWIKQLEEQDKQKYYQLLQANLLHNIIITLIVIIIILGSLILLINTISMFLKGKEIKVLKNKNTAEQKICSNCKNIQNNTQEKTN